MDVIWNRRIKSLNQETCLIVDILIKKIILLGL